MDINSIMQNGELAAYLLQSNFPAVLISVFLIIFLVTFRTFNKRITRLFIATIIMVLILICTDSIELYYSTLPDPHFLRKVMSALGYVLRPAVAFMVILIARRRNEKYDFFQAVPLAIDFIFCTISCFTDIVFGYTADNQFYRGTLGYLPFVVSGLYLLYMAVYVIAQYRERAMSESIIIIAIVVMSFASTMFEAFFHFKFILDSTLAVSVTFYYLYLHTQIFKRDTLTSLLNRRCFYLDAAKLTATKFAVMSIDLNHLKIINDTEGHAAGDKAIITMVKVISSCMGKNCTLYRTGGDEFMMICTKAAADKTDDLMDDIQRHMSRTDYSLACGSAIFNPGDNFEKVCSKSDAAMYRMKVHMKAVRND